MENRVLIIGPFGERGGREIEAGFFAKTLAKNGYDLRIFSTSNITRYSQVCDFFPWDKVDSVNYSIFRNKWIYRLLAYVSWLKNEKVAKPEIYTANLWSKRLLNYYGEVEFFINQQVEQNDLIIFLGQISSNHINFVIAAVQRQKKQIIFRTTGAISNNQQIPEYFNPVDLFLHHSKHNHSKNLLKITPNFKILDQTALYEESLLSVPIREKKIRNFIILGEVSRHKGLDTVLKYFSSIAHTEDQLLVLGKGNLKTELQKKYKNKDNIVFEGHVQHGELAKYMEASQCLIIASEAETGPLVGIEAMAAGLLILSTRVGAMEERLEETKNNFWFQKDNFGSFETQFKRLKALNGSEVKRIAESNRNNYLKNYSNKKIGQELVEIVRVYLES